MRSIAFGCGAGFGSADFSLCAFPPACNQTAPDEACATEPSRACGVAEIGVSPAGGAHEAPAKGFHLEFHLLGNEPI
jgi:hypothetical protein